MIKYYILTVCLRVMRVMINEREGKEGGGKLGEGGHRLPTCLGVYII